MKRVKEKYSEIIVFMSVKESLRRITKTKILEKVLESITKRNGKIKKETTGEKERRHI